MTACTSDEAIAATGYLARCFGGFAIPDDEKRAFTRLFRHYEPLVVRAAIDELVRTSSTGRRPSPAEVAAKLRTRRPSVADTRNPEPIPDVTPDHVAAQIAYCKSQIHQHEQEPDNAS